ncbi:MAG: hypothetical protein KUG71_13215 [Porticoccaceae bacterium]|nr:hypothetical protein [Porticoccaceae bacterium]
MNIGGMALGLPPADIIPDIVSNIIMGTTANPVTILDIIIEAAIMVHAIMIVTTVDITMAAIRINGS